MSAPMKGPAFTDGREAFRAGVPLTRVPSLYADGSTNHAAWELGWRVAERQALRDDITARYENTLRYLEDEK
jgi:hypothetical protein